MQGFYWMAVELLTIVIVCEIAIAFYLSRLNKELAQFDKNLINQQKELNKTRRLLRLDRERQEQEEEELSELIFQMLDHPVIRRVKSRSVELDELTLPDKKETYLVRTVDDREIKTWFNPRTGHWLDRSNPTEDKEIGWSDRIKIDGKETKIKSVQSIRTDEL